MCLREFTHNNGLIKSESFEFHDDIIITTDKKEYRLSEIKSIKKNNTYKFYANNAEFIITYNEVPNAPFITRAISIQFNQKTTLLKISATLPTSKEHFLYETFFNASAAVFLRNDSNGFCCGFENPYCQIDNNTVFFEPMLILDENEKFDCDLNFYGSYEIWGELIQPCLNKTQIKTNGRYHPRYRNPSEGISLYFSEIQAFRHYTDNYFECDKKLFKFMVYDFFGNMTQRPENNEEYQAYLKHIDTAAEMGCDTILLNPLFPNKIPDANENSYWELFPNNTYAENILVYAKSKGLKVGMYTGTAGNSEYGNSSMICYADTEQWKKKDIKGNISTENCLADDSFTDWYIKVQSNTIKKYGLDLWSWDPGPGNGFFCFNNSHGHIPGAGAYKGFRNSLKVMRRLKEEFPNLYIEGFHGNKEYGLWGFKYIDQHEAFWENEVYVMNPIYSDLSVDRITANNIRQQSVWNHYFRFMPETLNHGITHRMIQSCWMKLLDLDKVFDYVGWKYALLSSIAVGGSITPTILPYEPDKIHGYVDFYKKWIEFAKNIFPLSRYTIPFGAQVGCGIDGYSKILKNEGFVFLFNPFPQNIEFEVTYNRRIGFTEGNWKKNTYMIYPYQKAMEDVCYGTKKKYIIPAYECIIINVSDIEQDLNDEILPPLPRVLKKNNADIFTFTANTKIEELIRSNHISNDALKVQETYAIQFNHINSCWNRPDRLWLWFEIQGRDDETPSSVSVTVNGKSVTCIQDCLPHNELCIYNMCFADITDFVKWNRYNEIQLSDSAIKHIYLHYPKPQNEELPITGEILENKNYSAPVLDKRIRVLSAKLNSDNIILQNRENNLYVKINMPFEEMEGVYASVPISIGDTGKELKRDMALEYKDGYWIKKFKSGKRIHLIIDDYKISIWAVSKDKRESNTYRLNINWNLN